MANRAPRAAGAAGAKKRRRKSSIGNLLTVAAVGGAGLLLLVLIGTAAWMARGLLAARDDGSHRELQGRFQPYAGDQLPQTGTGQNATPPQGRNPQETAMLALAAEFVQSARQNDPNALLLVDKDLFHSRIYSPAGSYTAIRNGISGGKILHNLAKYSIEGVPGSDGMRHWHIVGFSRYEGLPGVVLRYYVEPETPVKAFEPVATEPFLEKVSYEQFREWGGGIYARRQVGGPQRDHRNLASHGISQVFPRRMGYLMLVMDTGQPETKLVDIVNVMGQAPISRTGAAAYLSDWHVFSVGMREREYYGTKRETPTLYGLVQDEGGITWSGGEAEEAKARAAYEKRQAEVAELRPSRLRSLMTLYNTRDERFDSELARYRKDFRNDLGFEMALVFQVMAERKPSLNDSNVLMVSQAADRLYEVWKDPVFLYVKGLSAHANGRTGEGNQLFRQALAEGFQSADMHARFLEEAVAAGDVSAIRSSLEAFARYSAPQVSEQDDALLARIERRWADYEARKSSVADGRDPSSRSRPSPFGRSSRFNADRLPMQPRGRDSATPGPATNPGSAGRFGDRTDFRPPERSPRFGGGPPPQDSGPGVPGQSVVIQISSNSGFNAGELSQQLRRKLDVQGHSMRQSGNNATIRLSYPGNLDQVKAAIDFGTVTETHVESNTIVVTIP